MLDMSNISHNTHMELILNPDSRLQRVSFNLRPKLMPFKQVLVIPLLVSSQGEVKEDGKIAYLNIWKNNCVYKGLLDLLQCQGLWFNSHGLQKRLTTQRTFLIQKTKDDYWIPWFMSHYVLFDVLWCSYFAIWQNGH